jgi:hypothetical protein
VGFIVDKVALGQVFSEFSLPTFPPTAPHLSPIIHDWYSRSFGPKYQGIWLHHTPNIIVMMIRECHNYISSICVCDVTDMEL